MVTASIIITHHRTIVSLNSSGTLFHHSPESGETSIIINSEDISGSTAKHIIFGGVTLELDNQFPSMAVIRANDRYMSATPDGSFAQVAEAREWERYSIVPINMVAGYPDLPSICVAKKQRAFVIPHLIHQTYGTSRIPERYRANITQLKANNPGWSYMLWDDKDAHDFINQNYGWSVLKYYIRINPRYGAAKADLFRYLLMYQLGGVYLDIKSSCKYPLNEVIRDNDQYLLAQWDHSTGEMSASFGLWPELSHISGGEFQQWHIVSAPGHPFLEHVINRVLKAIHHYREEFDGVGSMATLRVTGPIPYTLSIDTVLSDHTHRIISPEANPFIYINVDNYHGLAKSYRTQTTPLIL